LKKPGADQTDVNNYRPISNLTFMSKIVERLVCQQLVSFLEENKLLPNLQSAYRKHHSTETVLLKVVLDILQAADSGQVSLLCLLDLSAAFDTVDHNVLIDRLQKSYGLNGTVLSWIQSFVHDRTQSVVVGGEMSTKSEVKCGVPQGSVLGPILFLLYTADVLLIAERHGFQAHSYADDTQLYFHCIPGTSCSDCVKRIVACIAEMEQWMSSNYLRLNTDKTQFIWLGTPVQLSKVDCEDICVGNTSIHLSTEVTCLYRSKV